MRGVARAEVGPTRMCGRRSDQRRAHHRVPMMVCPRHLRPFPPCRNQLAMQYGIPVAVQMPIDPVHAEAVDSSTPLVLQESAPASQTAPFSKLADAVIGELERLEGEVADTPSVSFDPVAGVLIRQGGRSGQIDARTLRLACIEMKMTGANDASIPSDGGLAVTDVVPKGNFAVEVFWSDGYGRGGAALAPCCLCGAPRLWRERGKRPGGPVCLAVRRHPTRAFALLRQHRQSARVWRARAAQGGLCVHAGQPQLGAEPRVLHTCAACDGTPARVAGCRPSSRTP